jgi:ribosomal protein S18 acetylase RimI-like enzyme
MSLYADYLHERTDDLIAEREWGFATYRVMDPETVYIVDIFVRPEVRRSGAASELADEIAANARANGYKWLLGTVMPSTKGSTDSLKVLLAYGMTLWKAEDDAIWFRKPL